MSESKEGSERVDGLGRAGVACLDVAFWHAEVRRLRSAIGDMRCPQEVYWMDNPEVEPVASCFSTASQTEWTTDRYGEDAPKRRNLAEIEAEVAACPACTRLCALIRERREAKRRLGNAKRAVHYAGRALLRSTTGGKGV